MAKSTSIARSISFDEELNNLAKYLKSEDNEDAKRQLLFPLFQKLFNSKFKTESAAQGADIYIEGQLIVESKTKATQWLEGFYQALHYKRKYGLTYNTIMVIARNFCAIWKLDKLPEHAVYLSKVSDATVAPNIVGKENARKSEQITINEIKNTAIFLVEPKDFEKSVFAGGKSHIKECFQILNVLRNLDKNRIQVNSHNFIQTIERLKHIFEQPIDAVHAFYAIIPYWDETSIVIERPNGSLNVLGINGRRSSEDIFVSNIKIEQFKIFVETQYIFTNEGSGLTVDYYFSRFDEVLAIIDPEYVKQHGIFFTDANLCRFALWFAKQHISENINDNFIVFDPAAGSGNLISSWRSKLKHKIVSELQPDLLKIIDRRMRADPFHIETGFTVIPRPVENKGLNFLDISASNYMAEVIKELNRKNIKLDKPLAFLLNPPYKNTDENISFRDKKDASYFIDNSILEITGEDASKERYLAFLGQILNICKWQNENSNALEPILMVFTPTSWLIPRPTYAPFREKWDMYFSYQNGFIVKSNEFFKIEGKWPLAFTIWKFDKADKKRINKVRIFDLSELKQTNLCLEWDDEDAFLKEFIDKIFLNKKQIRLDNARGDIRETLNNIERRHVTVKQPRLNIYRNRNREEVGKSIVSGFPLKDERHFTIKDPYGFVNGAFIGFMDDNTPVRINQEPSNRLSNSPDRVWFRLDIAFADINKTRTVSSTPSLKGFCAYNLESAKATFTWFTISKILNGKYPIWANQYDIWAPEIKPELADYWYALCFSFVLSENRCIVTKFEADNPVKGALEVFVDNPLCPTNKDSFWSTTLDKQIVSEPNVAIILVNSVKTLYKIWNLNYCKGQWLYNVGLKDEPYFKYFDYPDFLTPYSGLIQIRKYATQEGAKDLLEIFESITSATKDVKDELYRLLVEEFGYFD